MFNTVISLKRDHPEIANNQFRYFVKVNLLRQSNHQIIYGFMISLESSGVFIMDSGVLMVGSGVLVVSSGVLVVGSVF